MLNNIKKTQVCRERICQPETVLRGEKERGICINRGSSAKRLLNRRMFVFEREIIVVISVISELITFPLIGRLYQSDQIHLMHNMHSVYVPYYPF